MFKKLFYRRSLKAVIENLSKSHTHFDRVTNLIADFNDLYLACTYGNHFKRKVEAEKMQIEALKAEKHKLLSDIALLEKQLEPTE